MIVVSGAALCAAISTPPSRVTVPIRTRVEPFKGSGDWREVKTTEKIDLSRTAVILCDVWDRHWCASASRRCGDLAAKMQPVVASLRRRGAFIIHAPSDTMKFYDGTPQRRLMQQAPECVMPTPRSIAEPPLPIDDSDGGCDDVPQCAQGSPWKRQHAAVTIAPEDGVSDNGEEVYRALKARGIGTLIVMGVHTNMCVLGRSFAIRQMTKWGIRCILARDLTDTMYNPRMAPKVQHEKGTELVIEHIEKYWCPTVLSKYLLKE